MNIGASWYAIGDGRVEIRLSTLVLKKEANDLMILQIGPSGRVKSLDLPSSELKTETCFRIL